MIRRFEGAFSVVLHAAAVARDVAVHGALQRRVWDKSVIGLANRTISYGMRAVSFDVFDTALLRRVARPDDVMALSAFRTVTAGKSERSCPELVAARRLADRRARERALRDKREEISFEEIWDNFPPDFTSDERSHAAKEELCTERAVCVANEVFLGLYRTLKERGVPVVFTSDTPHSSQFISELLVNVGFDNPAVICSSEMGQTKAGAGHLFSSVAEILGVPRTQILHVGDNLRSDFVNGRRAGLRTLWYRPRLFRSRLPPDAAGTESDLARSVLVGSARIIEKSQNAAGDVWSRIGSNAVAPMLLSLSSWLVKSASQAAVTRLVFLSRDGRLLQRSVRVLFGSSEQIPDSYLHVSRRSLSFPMFKELGPVELGMLSQHYEATAVKEVLRRIGLDSVLLAQALESEGLEPDTVLKNIGDDNRLRRVLKSSEALILAAAQRERINLFGYLARQGLLTSEHIGLVDIGWRGSMQMALAEAIRAHAISPELTGFYFGTNREIQQLKDFGGKAVGWIQNEGREMFGKPIVRAGWPILELVFSSSEGSTVGYEDGIAHYSPRLSHSEKEVRYGAAADAIQAGALEVLESYSKAFLPGRLAGLCEEVAIRELTRLILSPTRQEAKAIGDLELVEGFGASWSKPIARPGRLIWLKPLSLFQDYKRAAWRRGFLRRLPGGVILRMLYRCTSFVHSGVLNH